MFSHQGHHRTHSHNIKIATLLSFVAGFVNVTGFVSIHKLTTNVTGHFAFFVDDIYQLRFTDSIVFFIFILSFFLGAFVSNTLVEIVRKKSEKNTFVAPIVIEIIILYTIAIFGSYIINSSPNTIAIVLLFAMGIQNSLVTKISNAVVRTTHLTGLFTDLGIETSQLFFYKTPENKSKLIETISLRLTIISFFFIGGIAAGILYKYFGLYSLIIPPTLLALGLIYDNLKFKIAPNA